MNFDGRKSFKIVMLGEGAVGKTSLMLRYTENKFVDKHISTVQAAFGCKQLDLGDKQIELAIWDTAGQEKFHSLGPIYYRNSHGALLVYDITDRKSFDRAKKWVVELRQMLGDEVTLFVVGNKIDLEQQRNVSTEEAKCYAESVNSQFLECSAKTNVGVDDLFMIVAQTVMRKNDIPSSEENCEMEQTNNGFRRHGSRRNIRIVEERQPEKRRCC